MFSSIFYLVSTQTCNVSVQNDRFWFMVMIRKTSENFILLTFNLIYSSSNTGSDLMWKKGPESRFDESLKQEKKNDLTSKVKI